MGFNKRKMNSERAAAAVRRPRSGGRSGRRYWPMPSVWETAHDLANRALKVGVLRVHALIGHLEI
jgi:hypothetical protein